MSIKILMVLCGMSSLQKEGPMILVYLFYFKNPTQKDWSKKWSIFWADNCPGQNKNNYYVLDLIRHHVY